GEAKDSMAGRDWEKAIKYLEKLEVRDRSEEHTHEVQSQSDIVYRLLLEKKTHNANISGRSRHLARKLILRTTRSSPNVSETPAKDSKARIILIKIMRLIVRKVSDRRGFKIVVIDTQITLKKMIRVFLRISLTSDDEAEELILASNVNRGMKCLELLEVLD